MGTSGHALGRIAAVRQDVESLYVAGAGPVGLGVIAMAKARFGSDFPVYVADLDLWRLEFAESLGATVDDAAHPSNLTADIAVDTTGAPGARRRALDCLAQRGALALVGHGRRLELEVSPDLIAPERAILGSEYFRFDELQPNLNILLSTPKRFKQIITDVLPRSEIKEAFSLFLTGRTGKVVVVEDPS
jgi:threonine dehydrogenase-like Zn-dependent dehydrogenase